MLTNQALMSVYRRHLAERRAEQRRRTEVERAEAAREQEAELAEIRATCEPLLADRQLCSALILYWEALVGGSNVSTPSEPSSLSEQSNGGAFLALPLSAASRRRSSGFSAYSGASSHYATPLGCSPATTPMSGMLTNQNVDQSGHNFWQCRQSPGQPGQRQGLLQAQGGQQ